MRLRALGFFISCTLLMSSGSSFAQNANEIFRIFGGMMQNAVIQGAIDQWRKISQNEVACVDQRLIQRGSSIRALISQGITPSDPRVASIRSDCRGQLVQPTRQGPSFDCAKAKLPDEQAICSDGELSQLDNLVVDGYNYLRSRYGYKFADTIGVPLWRARQACGSDATCIKQKQLAAIEEYRSRGAPIVVLDSAAARSVDKSIYVVDGLTLGSRLNFNSQSYGDYKCAASEEFVGFVWCQKKVDEQIQRGQFTSSYSLLHSQSGVAVYVNRILEPAWFLANEANDDISARSKRYGAPSRFIPMPSHSSVPNGMIVTWGNVVLESLDSNSLKQLAASRDVHFGFMIDHLGNVQRSAQQGLPVYRLMGGAGYVWAASWDQVGVGTLRFLAIDASAMVSQMSGAIATEPAKEPTSPVLEFPQPQPSTSPTSPAEEAASIVTGVKSTLSKVVQRSASLRNPDSRKRVEEIGARIATANAETPLAELRILKGEADDAVRIIEQEDEFARVSELANKRVAEINAELDKITSDAPLIQKLQVAIKTLRDEQSGTTIGTLQAALRKLNKLFDENRAALKDLEFESP